MFPKPTTCSKSEEPTLKDLDIGNNLLLLFVAPLTLCCLVFYFAFDWSFLPFLKGSYYWLFALLCIALSAFGRIRLFPFSVLVAADPGIQILPIWRWILQIFAAQGVLLLLLTTFNAVIFFYTPLELQSELHSTPVLQIFSRHLFLKWGLYPWSLYGLIALSYGYFVHCRGQAGHLSSTLACQFQTPLLNLIGPSVDFLARGSALCVIALTLGTALLAIHPAIAALQGLPHFHPFIFRTLFLAFICFWLLIAKPSQKLLEKLLQHNSSLGFILLCFALILSVVMALTNAATLALAHHLPLSSTAKQTQSLQHGAWLAHYLLANWTYLFLWTPFMSSYIARISYGRSLRAVALVTLATPLIALVFWQLQSDLARQLYLVAIKTGFDCLMQIPYLALLGLITLLLLYVVLRKPSAYVCLDYGAFYEKSEKGLRRPLRILPQLMRFVGGLFAIFITGWLLFLPLILLIITVAVLVPINLSWIALYFGLSEQKD